jgi:hypothetical protein
MLSKCSPAGLQNHRKTMEGIPKIEFPPLSSAWRSPRQENKRKLQFSLWGFAFCLPGVPRGDQNQ